MTSPRIRRLWLEDAGDAREELRRRGFDEEAACLIGARLRPEAVWVEGLNPEAARALANRLREAGGQSFTGPAQQGGPEPLLLLAAPAELAVLAAWAAEQEGEWPAAAEDLGRLAQIPGGPRRLLGRDCSLVLDRPRIMGILNVTPDSFSDGGRYTSLEAARRRAGELAEEGADLIDVGGESTRPGSEPVPLEVELQRVVPVLEALRREVDLPLSVDTTKSEVARAAVESGAGFINDISGLRFDSRMAAVAAETAAGLFLMHTPGRPRTMQRDTGYRDLPGEVIAYLRQSIALATAAGIPEERLAIDPGIGFGKSASGNLQLLRRLPELKDLGLPILLGTSRKSFIGRVLQQPESQGRLHGTLATVALGVAGGARIFRVHDVAPAREAALMAWAVARGGAELPADD